MIRWSGLKRIVPTISRLNRLANKEIRTEFLMRRIISVPKKVCNKN